MKKYNATLDTTAKIITFLIFGVLIFPVIRTINHAVNGYPEMWIIVVVLLLSFIAAYLYRPLSYQLDDKSILINRPIGQVSIPFENITEAKFISKKDAGFGIRTFGVGGFLGYYGRYMYKHLGYVTQYVTDTNKMVLIGTAKRYFIISPDETDDFLKELVSKLRKYK